MSREDYVKLIFGEGAGRENVSGLLDQEFSLFAESFA